MYEEGDIADGPNGQALVFRGGAWVPMGGGVAPAPMTIGTPDPAAAYKGPQAAVDLEAARARAATAAASAPYAAQMASDQARMTRAQADEAVRKAAAQPKTSTADSTRLGMFDALVQQVKDTEAAYRAGPGATKGIAGLWDYLPSDANSVLDTAGAGLADQVTAAFKIPGMGSQSDADAARLAAATQPFARNRDVSNEQQFKQLKSRIDFTRKAAGFPAANWSTDESAGVYGAPKPQMGIASGATTTTQSDPDRKGVPAALDRMLRTGKPDDEVKAFAKGYGATDDSIAAILAFRKENPSYKGSYDTSALGTKQVPLPALSLSGGNSPLGAYFASGADALSLGTLDNLTSDPAQTRAGMAGVSAANPMSSLAGTVTGGAIAAGAGELGLARAGLTGVRAAMAGDALYGAGYGAGTSDDGSRALGALGGGTAGVLGGMFGRGATRAIGNVATGVRNGAARQLRDLGVPLTAGQALSQSGIAGRAVKGIEDRLTGIPIVGDMVNRRRLDGIRGFNRAAFDEGLAPIGRTTAGEIGETGIETAQDAVSGAYGQALNGVRVNADQPFIGEMRSAVARGAALPEPMRGNIGYTLPTRVGNSFDQNGGLTGNGFQQSVRGLRQDAAAVRNEPYGADFGGITRDAEGALEGLLNRQAPDVMPAYRNANEAFRNTEVLRDTVNRGRNGTRVGEPGLFAPSQLADAAAANAKKFGNSQGTTRQPFFDLSRAGQQVLPSSIADSGTAGRLAVQGGLGLAGLGALGGGTGYATGDAGTGAAVTGTGVGLAALLAAGGTRAGQRALTAALIDRPDLLVRIGGQIQRRSALGGMFGASGAQTLIPRE